MSRFVDRGAIAAAWVGVGLAVTVGVSFMLVIPIEFLVAPFALLGGLLIGYYANARSDRAGGPWRFYARTFPLAIRCMSPETSFPSKARAPLRSSYPMRPTW